MKKSNENKTVVAKETVSKEKETFTLDEKSVLTLSQKDIDALNANKKSFLLNNWLKDELVIQAYLHGFSETKCNCSVKVLQRISKLLGYYRESQILKYNHIEILDRDNVSISYKVDLDDLNNAYRRYLNQNYDIVELPYEIEDDSNIEDIDRIQHSFN